MALLGLSIPVVIAGVATAHLGLHRTALAAATAPVTTARPRPARPMTGHAAPRAALLLVCRLYRLCRGLHKAGPAGGSVLAGAGSAAGRTCTACCRGDTAENHTAAGDQGTAGKRRGCI
jgi:hypothetical protein